MYNFYKDCDLETGVNKLLHNFANEENKDYNTINLYSDLIIEFIENKDEVKKQIDVLELDLEDKCDAIRSINCDLDELKDIVSNMRKSETKDLLSEIISRMELSVQ